MHIPATSICVMTLMGFACAQEAPSDDTELFGRIRLLAQDDSADGNKKLDGFLKSLTPAQMLSAAREACAEVESTKGEFSDAMRAGSASMSVALCLHFYLDGFDDSARAIKTVLAIVADTEESWLLRHAIIEQMYCSRFNEFVDGLQTYVNTHVAEIDVLLSGILRDSQEHSVLRGRAVRALASVLRQQISAVCAKDANVIAMRERTHRVLSLGELVRSGELTLTEETTVALKPIEERIRANVKLLEGILADRENEPEALRGSAQSMLQAYRRSVLIGLDDEIDKALQHTQR